MPKPSRGGGSSSRGKGRKGKHGVGRDPNRTKISTMKREEADIKHLERRIKESTPERGTTLTHIAKFTELPVCRYTQSGLVKSKFVTMTEIQRGAIPHALAGRDILGAAKTGSGKTLAFLIPVLELLYRRRWSPDDGLGALIISPTRELAVQIFEVLRKIGVMHFSLSAGLVTGGKRFDEEQNAISRMNILIATPGRLLQHLEQSPFFNVQDLQMLVLDEADRILDMGFSEQLNSILGYLPTERQTLLFSATQTRSVKDLARLSLKDPEYVSVHEESATSTPSKLVQTYVVVNLQDKLNMLYSFIRTHLKQKTIVFVSSCKQARFVHEVFRRMRPGVTVLPLHGKLKPYRRTEVFYEFNRKSAAILFCTDVAARGLDFSNVDWVVQMDCPEDAETYIHRAGRTARYKNQGKALLVLTPAEAPGMVKVLQEAKIPLKQITVNADSALNITGKVAAEVAADPDLRYIAQRAFVSYVRSVYLQPNKEVFQVSTIPVEEFASSLGLPSAPQVKMLKEAGTREEAKKEKNNNSKLQRLKQQIQAAKAKKRAALERGEAEDYHSSDGDSDREAFDARRVVGDSDVSDSDSDAEGEDDLFRKKAPQASAAAGEGSGSDSDSDSDSSDALADEEVLDEMGLSFHEKQKILRKARETKYLGRQMEAARQGKGGKTPFQRLIEEKAKEAAAAGGGGGGDNSESFAARVAARLQAADAKDKEMDRERVRRMHKEAKAKKRGEEEDEDDEGGVMVGQHAILGSGSEASSDNDDDGSTGDDDTTAGESDGSGSEEGGDGEAAAAAEASSKKRKRVAVPESLADAESMALELLRRKK